MKAKVYITPKKGILDPQGAAIEHALPALGFGGVANVRVGKYIELDLSGRDGSDEVDKMCKKLLANPIIEDFKFELVPD